jgi:nicotinamidase-related amidase
MKVKIISIDVQKAFSAKGGRHYRRRPAVDFIKETLVPYLLEKNIKIAEIISDYRQPRKGDSGHSCVPGTSGYESEIDERVKTKPIWIKAMNSPAWTRKGAGNPKAKPEEPYPDPGRFTKWLEKAVGKPEDIDLVVLIGLTADCCVFCTAQELAFRGYKVKLLKEGTDTYGGSQKEKKMILENYPLKNWAGWTTWKELKKIL